MELKDLLGGKGANLAEMTSVLGCPCRPGFTITTDACRAYMARRLARRASTTRSPRHVARLEKTMGQRARRPRRPAAGQRALGRQVLDARDDGHRPQPRPQRRVGRGPGRRRPATSASPTTPTAASSRCTAASCSTSTARRSTSCSTRPRSRPASRTDADIPAGDAARAVRRATRTSSRSTPAQPFPQDPTDQLRGAIEAVFRVVERRPGRRLPRAASTSPHDLGTAVNVQAMVFGNRDDSSGTGVGFTRDAATGEHGRLRRLPRQRPGRGRGGRHPQHRAARRRWRATSRRSTTSCSTIFARLERHYRDMCDTEFTIEQGKLWMLQTRVGKRTGAAALRMAVDMTKDKRIEAHPGRGPPAGHRRAPRPGAAPAVRGRRRAR